jgi:hypothetical protein
VGAAEGGGETEVVDVGEGDVAKDVDVGKGDVAKDVDVGGGDEAEKVDVGEGDVGAAEGGGGEAEGDPSKPGRRRKKLAPNRVHCSIKFTLGASINRDNALALEFFKEIGICVDGSTRTAFETARFLNYFFTKLLAEGREVPEIDETVLYGVFTTMAGARKASTIEKLGEALNDYEDLHPAGMARFDCEYVAQMLLYAAREYITASKNQVVLNLVKRIEKAFMRFFRALKQKFRRGTDARCGAADGKGGWPRRGGEMWAAVSEVPTAATSTALRAYFDRNLNKYADLPLDAAGPNPTYVVEKRWWAYVRWLHDLQVIEHEKASLAELHDIEFKPVRVFIILPLCSYDSRHVTVDTVALHGLAKRIASARGRPSWPSCATFWTKSKPSTSTLARRRGAGGATRGAPASGC